MQTPSCQMLSDFQSHILTRLVTGPLQSTQEIKTVGLFVPTVQTEDDTDVQQPSCRTSCCASLSTLIPLSPHRAAPLLPLAAPGCCWPSGRPVLSSASALTMLLPLTPLGSCSASLLGASGQGVSALPPPWSASSSRAPSSSDSPDAAALICSTPAFPVST